MKSSPLYLVFDDTSSESQNTTKHQNYWKEGRPKKYFHWEDFKTAQHWNAWCKFCYSIPYDLNLFPESVPHVGIFFLSYNQSQKQRAESLMLQGGGNDLKTGPVIQFSNNRFHCFVTLGYSVWTEHGKFWSSHGLSYRTFLYCPTLGHTPLFSNQVDCSLCCSYKQQNIV